jgi:hypothetical protein
MKTNCLLSMIYRKLFNTYFLDDVCDDEPNPLLQDGNLLSTSTFEATILNGQTGMLNTLTKWKFITCRCPIHLLLLHKTLKSQLKTINTTCTASLIIPFIIHPLPNINLNTNGSEMN